MIKSNDALPHCFYCDYMHPIDNYSRMKLLLTTSTLSGVKYLDGWSWDSYGSVPLHLDIEGVNGGFIDPQLRRNWERGYSTYPLPIDTVVVAGLNDVNHLVNTNVNMEKLKK